MGDAHDGPNGPATDRQTLALYREIVERMVDKVPYRERARAYRGMLETLRNVHEQAGRAVPGWVDALLTETERRT